MFLERTENDADSLYGVEAFQPAPVEQVIAEMRKGVGGPLSLGDMADIAHLTAVFSVVDPHKTIDAKPLL